MATITGGKRALYVLLSHKKHLQQQLFSVDFAPCTEMIVQAGFLHKQLFKYL